MDSGRFKISGVIVLMHYIVGICQFVHLVRRYCQVFGFGTASLDDYDCLLMRKRKILNWFHAWSMRSSLIIIYLLSRQSMRVSVAYFILYCYGTASGWMVLPRTISAAAALFSSIIRILLFVMWFILCIIRTHTAPNQMEFIASACSIMYICVGYAQRKQRCYVCVHRLFTCIKTD